MQTHRSLPFSSALLGKPSSTKSAVFFNIVQIAIDPPPSFWTCTERNVSEGPLKKRVNVCGDKIMRKPVKKSQIYPQI